MENSVVTSSSLEITNMTYAQEQYGNFVDIHQPLLTISEFQKRKDLPLNEQCSSVFYAKTAHLTDLDFVEIDRPILQMIGFKNTFSEKKDKNGNLKLDEHGKPKLEDNRKDFNNAIRCLRNMIGFIESDSFSDKNADYVIKRVAAYRREALSQVQNGGQNKQEIWIRK